MMMSAFALKGGIANRNRKEITPRNIAKSSTKNGVFLSNNLVQAPTSLFSCRLVSLSLPTIHISRTDNKMRFGTVAACVNRHHQQKRQQQ